MLRDHDKIIIDEFLGLFRRGSNENAPPDHFWDCNNVQFSYSGVQTRDGLDTLSAVNDVVRMYVFTMTDHGDTILLLDKNGNLYHRLNDTTTYGPILSIPTMTDFGFQAFAGRAYITPFTTTIDNNGFPRSIGLQNEFVYVYKGDGIPARKAGGAAPTGSITVSNGASTGDESVEAGVHVIGVVYETDTGFLTKIGCLTSINAPGSQYIDISGVPISPSPYVTKRHIVASKAINPDDFTGSLQDYQLFFVPDGDINDNTTTTINVKFFDADLLDDAWHLLDLFEEIPAGVGLNTYHNRMLLWATYDDISVVRISADGEPEAFDEIDGLLIVTLDGNPITNCQEFRDVLYVFKQNRTYAYNDNGDVPSSWPQTVLEQGIGTSVHGIAKVLDSGGVDIDYLFICGVAGIFMFNGTFLRPELTWKIRDYWLTVPKSHYGILQIYNDPILQRFYVTLPGTQMLLCDYSDQLDPKSIKWAFWSFDINTSTIALFQGNTLIIGANPTVV